MKNSTPDEATKAGIVRTAAAVLGGATTLFVGRTVGSSAFGAVGLAVAWGSFMGTFCSAGIGPTLVRFGASIDEIGPRLRQLTFIGAISAALLSAAALALFSSFSSVLEPILAGAVGACSVVISVSASRMVLFGRLIRQSVVCLVSAIASGIAAVAVSSLTTDPLAIAAVFTIVGTSALTIGLTANNPWNQKRRPSKTSVPTAHAPVERVSARDFRSFLRRSWITNLVQMAVYRSDSLILGAVASQSELGRYLLMQKAVEALAMIVQTRASHVLGEVVFEDPISALRLTNEHGRIAFRTALSLGVLGAIGFGIVAPTFFGATFAQNRWWIAVLAIPSLILTSSSVLTSYFAARGELRFGLQASTVGVVLTLPLYVLLVPRYGLRGACLASGWAYLLQAAYLYVAFRRRYRLLCASPRPRIQELGRRTF